MIKTGLLRLGLLALGIAFALLSLEIMLRLLPQEVLNGMIERTSQRLTLYQLDESIGWRLRPGAETVITTRDERAIPITINSLGLRDTEHAYQKPPGAFRLLMLGDSFIEALDVHLEESFPYRAEQCLAARLKPPVEVINGGVSGYSPGDEYLFYQQEGVNYDPDLVLLVVYVGNDFSGLDHNEQERLIAGFGGYYFKLEEGALQKTWVSWEYPRAPDVLAIELFLRRHSRLWRTLAHPESKIYAAYRAWTSDLSPENGTGESLPWTYALHFRNFPANPEIPAEAWEAWAVFKAVVAALQNEVQAGGGQLAAVVIPANFQADASAREKIIEELPQLGEAPYLSEWDLAEPNRAIRQTLEAQGVPTLDLLPYFQAHTAAGGASLYFEGFVDEHLNRDGQRLMADVMCDWLIQNQAVRLPRE